MIRLSKLLVDATGTERSCKKCGRFRSYVAIGEWLVKHGETGKYYALPDNIKSIAGMKIINVEKINNERIIEMDGSYY